MRAFGALTVGLAAGCVTAPPVASQGPLAFLPTSSTVTFDRAALERAATRGELSMSLRTSDREVELRLRGDRWVLAPRATPRADPAAALTALFSALDEADPAGLAELLPTDVIDPRGMFRAARPRIEAARRALGNRWPSIVISGTTAICRYGPGQAVRFVFEADRWRVLDLE